MIINCIGIPTLVIFDSWDNTPTKAFLLSESRCVVGSSKMIRFRLDAHKRLAIPNRKDNAMLTCSPPLKDSKSKTSFLE